METTIIASWKVDLPEPEISRQENDSWISSCCTKITEILEKAFIALVFYITCCQCDLSQENTPYHVAYMSRGRDKPENAEELKTFIVRVLQQESDALVKKAADQAILDRYLDDAFIETVIEKIQNSIPTNQYVGLRMERLEKPSHVKISILTKVQTS